ncbi:MAG TPA: hypothetical protein VFU81_05300, partial [Thermomicrobiales bacterium]|nr:hypothetical protein [Thermomicrobiales bacterium]
TSLVGSKAYAESFTAGQAGKLTSGFIEAFNNLDAAETYTVELWDADAFGLPTGTAPLASTTVALPAEHGFHTAAATFATPPKLSKGQNYALVVTVPDAANNGVTVDPNNPCPGTFATSATGALGAFQPDPNNRDMVMAASIKVKRRHHRH